MRNRLAIPVLGAAFLVAFSPAPPIERELSKRRETIKRYGYSLHLPKDWKSGMIPPDMPMMVGTWQPDIAEARRKGDIGAYGAEVMIIRYPQAQTVTGEKAAEYKKKREEERRRRKFMPKDADNLDEFLDIAFEAEGRYVPVDIVAGRGKGKLEGKLLEFTHGRHFICVGRFASHGADWGIIYIALEEYYKKEWQAVFQQSLRTFQVFEGEVPVEAFSFDKKEENEQLTKEARRAQIAETIAGSPGWWAHETENYVFLTNSKKRRFIQTMAKEVEVLRKEVYEKWFPPRDEITAIGTVRVFSDPNEYHSYGGPSGSAGYWSSQHEELVLFDNFEGMASKSSQEFTKAVMYHEAFHQYIYYSVGDLAPHSWFNEGHGDYFAGHVIRGRRVKALPFDWRVKFLRLHLTYDRGLIPIRSLVRLPQREYYNNAGLKYAQGWALIYFLREVARKPEWKGIPDRYFAHLQENVAAFKRLKDDEQDDQGEGVEGIPGVTVYSWEDREKVERILEAAVEKGFEGVDYEELQEVFVEWVEKIT